MTKPKDKPNSDENIKPFRMPRGRPRKYPNAEMLENHIDDYIDVCEQNEMMVSMVGFANYAGMDKATLTRWGTNKTHDLSQPVKRLKQMCEEYLINRAALQNNPTGSIFLLKCNHNYIEVNKTINEVKAFNPKDQAAESVDNLIKKLSQDTKQDVIDITPAPKKTTE